ncbi:MAG: PilN domain-containing protein [Armatimonadetes bacterium]|nr:PilN domain-containing protein [Armatimonadota bacterium]
MNEVVPVLEWSGGAVRAFDPINHKTFMAESLGDAVAALGNPKHVGLAIGRRAALVRQLTLPEVSDDQAAAIVRVQLDQLFPVSSADLTSTFAHAHHQNGTGKKVVVSAMRTDLLKQAKAELAEHGVHTAWVAPINSVSGAVALESGLESAVVVDESVDGTGIDIVQHGDVCYSRSAPAGLNAADLDMEIKRTLASAKVPPSTVVRTDQYGNLGVLAHHWPSINLELQEEVAKRNATVSGRRRRLASLLTMVLVVCIAMVYFDFDDAQRKVQSQTRKSTNEITKLKAVDSLVSSRLAPLESAAATVDQAFKPKQPIADVLTVLAGHAPEGVWLTGLTVERGRNMTMRGTAKNSAAVTQYMTALNADPRFRDVRLVFANDGKIGEVPVVLFAATGHVVGNFPVYNPTNQSGAKK